MQNKIIRFSNGFKNWVNEKLIRINWKNMNNLLYQMNFDVDQFK